MVSKKIVILTLVGLVLVGTGYAWATSPDASFLGMKAAAKECRQAVKAGDLPKGACKGMIYEGHDAARRRDAGAAGVDEARPALPAFREENGTVAGRNLAFTVDREAGAIRGVTCNGPFADRVLLESVTLAGYNVSEARGHLRGGVWVGYTPAVSLVAFNAPNAALVAYSPEGATVTVQVADGITASETEGDSGPAIVLTDGPHKAYLSVRAGSVSLDGNTLTVTLEAKGGFAFRIADHPRLMGAEIQAAKRIFDHLHGSAGPALETAPDAGPGA